MLTWSDTERKNLYLCDKLQWTVISRYLAWKGSKCCQRLTSVNKLAGPIWLSFYVIWLWFDCDFCHQNVQMYEEKEELVTIIKQAAKERLQMEKQLAKIRPNPVSCRLGGKFMV